MYPLFKIVVDCVLSLFAHGSNFQLESVQQQVELIFIDLVVLID